VLILWIKAFHIIAVVCWFAAMFYLPRLFVYHVQSNDTLSIERFEVMERKLYRGIMTPSMIATWILGLWMVWLGRDYYLTQHWLHAKLALVVLLTSYHFMCGYYRRALIIHPKLKSHVFFRWFNEIPILLLIAVVILVVVKPSF
jgi:putative membrane protein